MQVTINKVANSNVDDELGMYREAHLHDFDLSFLAGSTDYDAPNVPETWTDAQGLPVPQPHGHSETEQEAEGHSVVDNVSDPAFPKQAASAARAVIGDFPWGCYWLPRGRLGTALCILADSASLTAIHQGPVVVMASVWVRTWAV